MLVSIYQIGAGILIIFALSMLSYMIAQLIVSSQFIYDDQFGSMGHLADFPCTYFALLLFVVVFSMTDLSVAFLRRFFKARRLEAAEARERARMLEDASDPKAIKEKIADYKRKYTPLSQSYGQLVEVLTLLSFVCRYWICLRIGFG